MLQCTLKRVEFCYLHIGLVKFAFEQIMGTSAPPKTACLLIARDREAKAAARPGRFGEQAQALIETRRTRRQAAPRGHLSDAIGVVARTITTV